MYYIHMKGMLTDTIHFFLLLAQSPYNG